MIKTIDTNEITEKMFQAFRDNYVDATRCIFAVLAAATAVEPAQRCNCCGYLVTDSEHKGCLRAAQQEQAQAVPVAWLPIETAPKDGTEILVTYGKQGFVMQLVRFDRTFNYWKNKGEAELGLENNATNWMPIPDPRKPLYTAPPAIDDETKRMVLELCRLIIDKAGPDSMITRAMAQKAEKISERLEAGE